MLPKITPVLVMLAFSTQWMEVYKFYDFWSVQCDQCLECQEIASVLAKCQQYLWQLAKEIDIADIIHVSRKCIYMHMQQFDFIRFIFLGITKWSTWANDSGHKTMFKWTTASAQTLETYWKLKLSWNETNNYEMYEQLNQIYPYITKQKFWFTF